MLRNKIINSCIWKLCISVRSVYLKTMNTKEFKSWYYIVRYCNHVITSIWLMIQETLNEQVHNCFWAFFGIYKEEMWGDGNLFCQNGGKSPWKCHTPAHLMHFESCKHHSTVYVYLDSKLKIQQFYIPFCSFTYEQFCLSTFETYPQIWEESLLLFVTTFVSMPQVEILWIVINIKLWHRPLPQPVKTLLRNSGNLDQLATATLQTVSL